MIKVLHVINHLGTGGAERLISSLLPIINYSTVKQRHRCLSLGAVDDVNKRRLLKSGTELIMFDAKVYSFSTFLKLFRWIKLDKPDLIHAHLFPSQLYISIISFLLHIPFVLTEHSTDNGRRGKWYLFFEEWLVYRFAIGVIAISEATKLALIADQPQCATKTTVIENGIAIQEIQSSKLISRTDVELPLDKVLLMSVGRLTSQKGFFEFLDVIFHLPKNFHWCIVGEGSEHDRIATKARQLGIEDSLTFLGSRNDVWSILRLTDIYIQPSISEGFGIAALEAMAQGLPVIHSGCPGLADTVGNAGVRIDIHSPSQAATEIERVWLNGELRSELSDLARNRSQRYSIEATASAHVEYYSGIVS